MKQFNWVQFQWTARQAWAETSTTDSEVCKTVLATMRPRWISCPRAEEEVNIINHRNTLKSELKFSIWTSSLCWFNCLAQTRRPNSTPINVRSLPTAKWIFSNKERSGSSCASKMTKSRSSSLDLKSLANESWKAWKWWRLPFKQF